MPRPWPCDGPCQVSVLPMLANLGRKVCLALNQLLNNYCPASQDPLLELHMKYTPDLRSLRDKEAATHQCGTSQGGSKLSSVPRASPSPKYTQVRDRFSAGLRDPQVKSIQGVSMFHVFISYKSERSFLQPSDLLESRGFKRLIRSRGIAPFS